MKKILYGARLFFISMLVCSSTFLSADAQKKPWTILVYIAGDNSLADFINVDLQEMIKGVHDNVNALAFVNSNFKGEGKLARKIVVTAQGLMQEGQSVPNVDSGLPETVIDACNWATNSYPSDRFLLILWNHGSGSLNRCPYHCSSKLWFAHTNACAGCDERGICYDDTTGSYLNDYDLQKILIQLRNTRGKNLDILACDACLMADIELAYTVSPYVDYYIASQETIPGRGYQYCTVLEALSENVSTQETAIKLVDSYQNEYKNGSEDYTLSAFDLSKTNKVVENVERIASLLLDALNKTGHASVLNAIKLAAYGTQNIRFEEPDYIDLYCFYLNLYRNIPLMSIESNQKNTLRSELYKGLKLVMKLVVHEASCHRYYAVRGVSIYLPHTEVDKSYDKLLWSKKTPHWLSLIKEILK